jgi:hypothetical protein
VVLLGSFTALLAAKKATNSTPKVIYIEPAGGFESYISAAFFKKKVPATIANVKPGASFVLKSGNFATQEEKSGLGKLARCAYAFCMGIDGSQTISVELRDAADKIVWAYSVRKIGTASYQSSAEAIAKHLKEFLEKNP